MNPTLEVKPYDLIVILGPTAAGKTKVAVALAKAVGGEIISADSRQVYRGMDIGTGKDLREYGSGNQTIPYHLIDICEPGDKYHVYQFQQDFQQAYHSIKDRGKVPILCGGTGLYIEAVLTDRSLTAVPVDLELRQKLALLDDENLKDMYNQISTAYDSSLDTSTRKRTIRAIEIKQWLSQNPSTDMTEKLTQSLRYKVFGLTVPTELRRQKITTRLQQRIEEGMIEEVEQLIEAGVTVEDLMYYGLEYKYVALYLIGELTKEDMLRKLETEIHRYAKRQMTYFRHMEKIGISIQWLDATLDTSEILKKIEFEIGLENF